MLNGNRFTKILASVLVACALVLAGCATAQNGAAGSGAAANKSGVNFAETFPSWNEDAPALQALVAYVEDVTDESSPNYIKPEERIVVSDFDGTLFGELNPVYFDWALSVHRCLYDSTYKATDEQIAIAKEIEETERTGVFQEDGMAKQAHMAAEVYGGMTPGELWDYAVAFAEEPSPRFKNMFRGEAYYVPMLEVVQYLLDNDFTFYVVTGSDRTVARSLVDGIIEIPPSQVIGSDNSMVATGQGDTDGLDYTWDGKGDDVLVFGGEFQIKDLKMNKVTAIEREIGVQPVVSLGNSSSDSAMLAYTVNDNPNKAFAMFVLADDTEREWGNEEKAAEYRELCEEQGWEAISTRDDWKTIYGGEVEKDNDWTWDSPDATGPNSTLKTEQKEAA